MCSGIFSPGRGSSQTNQRDQKIGEKEQITERKKQKRSKRKG